MLNEAELKRLEQAIVDGLAGAEVPFGAVVQALDYYTEKELGAALAGGQMPDDRAYNNGRAAALIDFKEFLAQKFALANPVGKKK